MMIKWRPGPFRRAGRDLRDQRLAISQRRLSAAGNKKQNMIGAGV